jgi:hypothetical protein
MMTRVTATAMLALLCTTAARAQSAAVWRCGPAGRSSSDTPCPGGLDLALDDPRSAAQLLAGQDVAAREKRLAEQLVRDRERRERLERQARLVEALSAAPRPATAAAAAREGTSRVAVRDRPG